MINAIFAHDLDHGIGYKGGLPWNKVVADFKWFKMHTIGHTVLMGSSTWEGMTKPLPGRRNVVVTRDRTKSFPGAEAWLYDPLIFCREHENQYLNKIVWVIGGAQLLHSMAGIYDRLYVSVIQSQNDSDTFIDKKLLTHGMTQIYMDQHLPEVTFTIYEKL